MSFFPFVFLPSYAQHDPAENSPAPPGPARPWAASLHRQVMNQTVNDQKLKTLRTFQSRCFLLQLYLCHFTASSSCPDSESIKFPTNGPNKWSATAQTDWDQRSCSDREVSGCSLTNHSCMNQTALFLQLPTGAETTQKGYGVIFLFRSFTSFSADLLILNVLFLPPVSESASHPLVSLSDTGPGSSEHNRFICVTIWLVEQIRAWTQTSCLD